MFDPVEVQAGTEWSGPPAPSSCLSLVPLWLQTSDGVGCTMIWVPSLTCWQRKPSPKQSQTLLKQMILGARPVPVQRQLCYKGRDDLH